MGSRMVRAFACCLISDHGISKLGLDIVPLIWIAEAFVGAICAGQNGIKDSAYSASSALSQDISMQPYIKRAGTDDSGCVILPIAWLHELHSKSFII